MTMTVKDPKEAALMATKSLNPHPEKGTDAVFLSVLRPPRPDAGEVRDGAWEETRSPPRDQRLADLGLVSLREMSRRLDVNPKAIKSGGTTDS